MHDLAPVADGVHRIAIFNPGSSTAQVTSGVFSLAKLRVELQSLPRFPGYLVALEKVC